jgi:hypothetical protein
VTERRDPSNNRIFRYKSHEPMREDLWTVPDIAPEYVEYGHTIGAYASLSAPIRIVESVYEERPDPMEHWTADWQRSGEHAHRQDSPRDTRSSPRGKKGSLQQTTTSQ